MAPRDSNLRTACVTLALLALAGCGDDDAFNAEMSAMGEAAFEGCSVCHGMSTTHAVGPGLGGVFGRKAGEAPGYAYSDALSAADIVWSDETLDKWLADPDGFIPGSNMVIDPVSAKEERKALIEWMKRNGG